MGSGSRPVVEDADVQAGPKPLQYNIRLSLLVAARMHASVCWIEGALLAMLVLASYIIGLWLESWSFFSPDV